MEPEMPLYEYECTACRRRTEKIQKFSDPELTECPFCGERLERTLTAPAVHFAGGGWYKDLYSSAKPAAAGSGESGAGDSKGEDSKGGESKGGDSKAGGSEGAGSSDKAATPAAAPAASTPAPAAKSGS